MDDGRVEYLWSLMDGNPTLQKLEFRRPSGKMTVRLESTLHMVDALRGRISRLQILLLNTVVTYRHMMLA
jgi:hypothetical protein